MHYAHIRRLSPRIPVESLCLEHQDIREHHALVVNLSENGLQLERPVVGCPRSRIVQLEFEIPEVDEIVWAKGEICFEEIRRKGPRQLVRRAGVQMIATTERHHRMLREYVNDTYQQWQLTEDFGISQWMMRASCYRD